MQRIFFFLIFISVTSCNYFKAKKTSSEAILNEEMQAFNWNEVDEYPNFSSCVTALEKEEKKECFENTLIDNIYSNLSSEKIIVTQDIHDTILVQFLISETGEIKFVEAKIDSITRLEIPNIEELITQSLESLPEIYPAIKRSQQVKTQFTLPILIQVN
ncbi:hypothetical protein ACFS5M_04295 [Lacinutrix iliipiscaria]|uniref:TonB C-terminal domain-containing protein n=1 Tax=Lacinutrix iliipiscaria TaxID=1230532 RepID=A0ABW5WM02_9FLAO